MTRMTSIVLAAGLSRRMGAQNKLLLPIGGMPLIRHMVDVYRTATDGRVVVVTGYQAEKVEEALSGSGADLIFNADFEQGQPTSVACGLRAGGGADQTLIGLGDQPLLTANDLGSLLAAHASGDPVRISIPAKGDRRGNPIVVPALLRERLLADPRSPGCRRFTRAHPEHVQFHPLDSPGFYADLDTPEAYAAFCAGALEDAI